MQTWRLFHSKKHDFTLEPVTNSRNHVFCGSKYWLGGKEQICPKRRNKMAVSTIRACFLLSVLNLLVKGSIDYKDTMKKTGKEFPTIRGLHCQRMFSIDCLKSCQSEDYCFLIHCFIKAFSMEQVSCPVYAFLVCSLC